MISSFYFFDQFSRASHVGGVYRSKRDLKDLNQALYHVNAALSSDDDHHHYSNKQQTITSTSSKKQTDDVHLQTQLREVKPPIIPEILTKELDIMLQVFDEKSRPNSASSDRSSQQEDHFTQPKISLPSLLIVQLHSTWSDLIQNTQHKYKVK